jgi:AhpD family alkylhydroperoxidase
VKDYSTIASEYHSGFGNLAKAIPGPASSFQDLMVAATKDGALSTKTKELIAFAIGITVRCDGCLAHHAQAVLKAGATREEVAEMIAVTLLMGGGPSSVYGVEAMRAYDEFAAKQTAAAE